METIKGRILPRKYLSFDERAVVSNHKTPRSPCLIVNIYWLLILEQKKKKKEK